jgi:hypothetical protein
MIDELKNYTCLVPFIRLEIHHKQNFMCCPSWIKKELPNNVPLDELWNSEEAKEIRASVLDGSFKFCDANLCPFLKEVINNKNKKSGHVTHESLLTGELRKIFDEKITTIPITEVKEINFSFDRSCNFKCPSCRTDYIIANTERQQGINATIAEIENVYSESVETLYISGTADAFASASYRNYLRNFDNTKYKKLKKIHLHTNGSLWNKEMWESVKNTHRYVKTCEISVDSGTKDTYENKTRIGGNWDTLIENLKFISTIKSLKQIKISFVVQDMNYKEMRQFYDVISSIFSNKIDIFYGRILNWGTYSDEDFINIDVTNRDNVNHSDFISEFNKIYNLPNVSHNLHEFITPTKRLI